jgi:hypothetical protein
MVVVNIAIDSDFEWAARGACLVWMLALGLYWLEGRDAPTQAGPSD